MIVVGQMNLIYLFEKRYTKLLYKHFAWLTEHIGNRTVSGIPVKNFDAALYAMPEEKMDQIAPELLITYGGHIVSKRLKKVPSPTSAQRALACVAGWQVTDLYGSLTTVIEMDPFEFLEKIAGLLETRTPEYPPHLGRLLQGCSRTGVRLFGDGGSGGVDKVLAGSIGTASGKQFGGALCPVVCRFAHRRGLLQPGTSGIEGSLSTAVGYAAASDKLNFVAIGDLSFFYDMNALWNANIGQPAHPFTE